MYRCVCDCGNEVIVRATHLKDGNTKSCGCFASEVHSNTFKEIGKKCGTHRMVNTRLYRIWGNMISRCTDINNPAFCNYGERGINVCDEWRYSFENFLEWANSSGYSDDLTLDRVDNDKGYYPSNCRWSDRTGQANNKRSNVFYDYNGLHLTLAQWARKCGIPYKTLHRRVKSLNWDFGRAITTKVS